MHYVGIALVVTLDGEVFTTLSNSGPGEIHLRVMAEPITFASVAGEQGSPERKRVAREKRLY
jgi:hypothetical protein